MSRHTAAQSLPFSTPPPPGRRAALHGLRKNVRISFIDGMAFSLMVGLGETYLPAFVLWMGLGSVVSGLITTLPLLLGACFQLISPWMVRRLGSYRRWVAGCATVQAIAFLPLVVCAATGRLPIWVAFAVPAVYWTCALGASGAWNSWMGTLIPRPIQVGFFTKRNRLTQGTVFAGFVMGGALLQILPLAVDKKWAYMTVFFLAFACRMFSVRWLRRQSEPIPPSPSMPIRMGVSDFVHRLHRSHEQGRLFTYMLSMTFAAQLAAPYFTSYMLGELQLPYGAYVLLVASSYLAKILMLPWFGRMAAARGTRPVLMLGGVGIVALPVLWLVSHEVAYLMMVQALSGLVWGAYELASLLLIWELVKPEDRTCALTIYNIANAATMSVASALGGWLLSHLGAGAHAFAALFIVSTIARGATLFWLGKISSRRLRWLPVVVSGGRGE